MAIIRTKKGEEIIVDDDKFEELNTYTWYLNPKGYALTRGSKKKHGHQNQLYMHRFLTNCPKDLTVDHINANRVDNRLENLEIVTKSENSKRVSPINRYKFIWKNLNLG